MVLDLAFSLAVSIFNLLKTSLFVAIPVFVLALATSAIQSRLSKKFGLSWVKTSFISTYLLITLLIFFLYFFPLLLIPANLKGVVPVEFQPSAQSVLFYNLFTVISLLIKSLIVTLLVIPLELLTAILFSLIDKKFEAVPRLAKFFAAIYAVVVLVIALVLFLFPWVLLAMVMMIYGGF